MKKKREYLLPVMLVLFILEILTLPVVLHSTYASGSDTPEHILTYKSGSLTWDAQTTVDAQGVAELSFFDALVQNAASSDGAKLVAPGMAGENVIRLVNKDSAAIAYTAVVYYETSSDQLPVTVEVQGTGFTDTSADVLPKTLDDVTVARAVKGTVKPSGMGEFDICWNWLYEEDQRQDIIDTALGDQAVDDPENVKIGVYIVVSAESDTTEVTTEDNTKTTTEVTTEDQPGKKKVTPSPKTGDDTPLAGYFVLLILSGGSVLILWIYRCVEARREKKHANDARLSKQDE